MDQSTHKDFLFHFTQGNYQAALDIAKDLSLDTNVVYKAQWQQQQRSGNLQPDDVDLLQSIDDDAWVVNQCLETVVDDWSLQRRILTVGKTRASNKDEDDSIWQQTRWLLNDYIERLETFIEIWPSLQQQQQQQQSFGQMYAAFRDANLVAQAVEYAHAENSHALRCLLVHHAPIVWPYRLAILAEIPETANPSQFDLPRVDSNDLEDEEWLTKEPWQQEDIKDTMIMSPEHTMPLSDLSKRFERCEFPAPASVIRDWYLSKAIQADRMGLCSQALEWIRHGRRMGIKDLEKQEAQLDWLCKYVYTCEPDKDEPTTAVCLEQFKTIPSYDVLDGLLDHTNDTCIVNDMRQLILPWLRVCREREIKDEEIEEDGVEMLLYRWLLGTRLDWCCLVLEASKPTLPADERIVQNDLDLSRLVLALLYSNDDTPIDLQVRLFECLPVFDPWDMDDQEEDGKQQQHDDNQISDMATLLPLAETPLGLFTALQSVNAHTLTRMMDALQLHLSAAEVLARYHSGVPLRWFLKEQPVEAQKQLCIRMASQAAGGVETGGKHFDSDNDWRELLDDMMALKEEDNKGVFGRLSRTDIFETFFTSLLRCGRFRLAKDLMVGPNRDKTLDIGRAEQLVIEAQQEFFDNATSGNMYAGNMRLAMECLKILPPTDLVTEETELIEATHKLIYEYQVMDRPGIELMPIQVRQSSNRLNLISKLINTRRRVYKQPADVVALARKLGYQDDLSAEVKVLAMLASAALVDEEYDTAYTLCRDTVDKVHAIADDPTLRRRYNMDEIYECAWQICFNLGKVNSFTDYPRRYDALAMALELSPVQHVHGVLNVWRKLDEEHPNPSQLDFLLPGSTDFDTDGQDNLGLGALKEQVLGFFWNRLSKP